jgi:hypothetical protein
MLNRKQLGMLAFAMAIALPAFAEDKDMKAIGQRLLSQATKGGNLLDICAARRALSRQMSVKDENWASIELTVFVRNSRDDYEYRKVKLDRNDEGFEKLNAGCENVLRELGASLVEKE